MRRDHACTSCPHHSTAGRWGQQLVSTSPLPSISSRKMNPDSTGGDTKAGEESGFSQDPILPQGPCTSTRRGGKEEGTNCSQSSTWRQMHLAKVACRAPSLQPSTKPSLWLAVPAHRTPRHL